MEPLPCSGYTLHRYALPHSELIKFEETLKIEKSVCLDIFYVLYYLGVDDGTIEQWNNRTKEFWKKIKIKKKSKKKKKKKKKKN